MCHVDEEVFSGVLYSYELLQKGHIGNFYL